MACVSCDGQQGADESCTQVPATDISEWVSQVSPLVTSPLPDLLLWWPDYIHRQKNIQDGNGWGADLGERLQESPSSQRTDYRPLCEVVTLDTDAGFWDSGILGFYSVTCAWICGLTLPSMLCCSTVLPDTSRRSRQKTRVVKRTANPMFNHTMVYDGFRPEDLKEACVEITVWDHDRLNNHYIGGLRLGLGTGESPLCCSCLPIVPTMLLKVC